MQQEGVRPSHITFIGVLNACASVAALHEGKRAHQQIVESGFESNAFMGSSLIDMYAKCGSMEEAQSVFNNVSSHNVVSWSIMICNM
jgi:pentatricopeptide repeat protein